MPSNGKASAIASSGAIYVVDRGFNSPNRKGSIRDFDLARLRVCPGKPGAGNPHAGFYLGGEAQGQPRLLPTDHRIDHPALLAKVQAPPRIRRQLKAWLTAGILEDGHLAPTTAGTPQGGSCSPLLALIALHGMDQRMVKKSVPPHNKRP